MAGGLLLERYGGPARDVESKSSATDLVSEADKASEAAIRDLLAHERPNDGLLGEEGSERAGDSGRRWVVDPLDGTINYLYGFPAWCVSVALEDADGSLVGVIHDPLRDETFCAERGGGCTLNGRSGRVDAEERLDTALIGTGFSYEADVRAAQAEPSCARCCRACATCAGREPPRWTSPGWPWDGSTATSSAGSSTGTRRRERCWSRRRAAPWPSWPATLPAWPRPTHRCWRSCSS